MECYQQAQNANVLPSGTTLILPPAFRGEQVLGEVVLTSLSGGRPKGAKKFISHNETPSSQPCGVEGRECRIMADFYVVAEVKSIVNDSQGVRIVRNVASY